jgi:hypothetical protein
MSVRSILAASLALVIACAGGSDSTLPGGGTPLPDGGTPPPDGGTTTITEPPGTTEPSGATARGGGLEIGANAGPGGALFINDLPLAGEPTISGRIQVAPVGTAGGPPPGDTLVTLNGVTLVRQIVGNTTYFTVDPGGPQPTIGADGFLHINASSASTGTSRALNLACPFAIAATLTPAPGASLSGVSSVDLAWPSGSIPVQGRDFSAFGLEPPSVSIHGFDSATRAMTFIANPQLLAVDSTGAAVPVAATSASGYAIELRYPGVFFLDGETGGACGRTQRFIYVK